MKFTEIPLIDRFNEKFEPVTESGCWIWTAFVNEWGYGSISVNKRMRYAHRISYELKNGKIPDGMLVLHRCDTPCCVNPDHLFLGSSKDNINDMMAKGRHRSGAHTESGNLKKLTKAWNTRTNANELIEKDKEINNLREALVYVAHASHRTPKHMLPKGVILGDDNYVEVKLNTGVTVKAIKGIDK